MIRLFVSSAVIVVSALAVVAAVLNSFMDGNEVQTLLVAGVYALFLALGMWSARSHLGALVLATCLVASGATLLVAARYAAPDPELAITVGNHSRSRWRVPVVLCLLGAALICDRWIEHRRAREAAGQ